MKKKNLLITAIAIFGLATITFGQTVPSYIPTSGLVGWWPFNGNANDESGNGNNGTVNGAILTSDRNGQANNAYIFSGQENISINDNPNLTIQNGTISVWFITNSLNPQMILTKRNIGTADNQNFHMVFYSNELACSINYNSNCQATGAVFCNATGNYSNNWINLVTTISNDSIKTYVNGNQVNSVIAPNSLADNCSGSPILIGRTQDIFDWFNGKIDDIGIWNQVLTQQEISDLYNGCQLSVNTQPTNQTININSNAQFVVGSSDPSATYQWQTDLGVGFQNLNSIGQYSGTTNDTLIVSNVTLTNNNQPFRCIVSSGSCSDTSNVAVLTVNNNVGINENTQDNLFSVFPNPVQSVIHVKAYSKLLGQVYSIYDNTGRVVLTGKLNSQNTTIELGNLSGGIYMFSVGENMKQTFKVIKE